ncbi:periplasmic Sensor Hybrid Histidine Kinase [gamma proteobacterium HTCC5015]|nr:periplasmic Sensor Hybrid Histidine Kinase [gamma proteobacterium HTCC5015]
MGAKIYGKTTMIRWLAPRFLRYTQADDPRVLRELFLAQYRQFTLNTTAILFFLIALAIIFHDFLRTPSVLAWTVAHMLTGPYFTYLFRRFSNIPEHKRDYFKWYVISLRMECFSGFMWGIMPLAFFPIYDNLTLPIIILGSVIVIAAAMALMFLPGGFAVYGPPAIFLQATTIIWLRPDLFIMGLLGYMYLGMSVVTSLNVNRAVARASLLRFKNQDMLESVEQANVAKSRFLASASHDLRQPLHALSLLLGVLSNKREYREDIVQRMQKSVSSLEMLFNSLLDISKLDANAVDVHIQDVPLGDVLHQLKEDYSGAAVQKGLGFHIDINPQHAVRSDPILLKRILSNLISNAFRYTPAGGHIDVAARQEGDKLVIEVRDTGPGIPADKHEEIFAEFVQLDNPERDRNKGLGLGLAIVRRLCHLLAHDVDLHSTADPLSGHTGTTFCIRAPLGAAPSASRVAMRDAPPASNSEHSDETQEGIVLVVDDEKMCATPCRICSIAGVTPHSPRTAAKARSKSSTNAVSPRM